MQFLYGFGYLSRYCLLRWAMAEGAHGIWRWSTVPVREGCFGHSSFLVIYEVHQGHIWWDFNAAEAVTTLGCFG